MRRRDFLRVAALGAAAAVPTPWIGRDALRFLQGAGTVRPNFVFILIDDLGWADLGAYGSRFHDTPNIDRLAAQAMRFTDAYAACPVCSPTRASILTGKYPARLHLTDYIPGEGNRPSQPLVIPAWQRFLPWSEMTIAKALRAQGYATASIGKWHLGGPADLPERYGFDVNVGGSNFGQPASYFWPYQGSSYAVPGLRSGGAEGEYLTDRLTGEAERFITAHKNAPFLLYFPHFAVHTPLMGKPDTLAKYKNRPPVGDQKNPAYAAMVESVDDSVGRILHRLDAEGLTGNTVVIFMSDNGGLWPQATSNAPLRAGKGFPYEGGIREPLIVHWPGVTRPGAVSAVPVSSIDFLPTLLDIAGVAAPGGIDGVSLVPLLRQTGGLAREALFWHYPHYWGGEPPRVRPFGAVRAGDWKLIEFYEDMRVELFNLKDDIGETRDLAGALPDRAARLRRRLHDWRADVGAQMPTPR